MKKVIISLPFVISIFSAQAQKASDASFDKSTSYLHAGIGFGGGFYSGSITLPPISVSYEKAITENISVGGIIGYSSSNFNDGFGTDYKNTYILIGARGNYHFATSTKFDPYVGATLGYNIVSTSYIGKGSALLAGGQIGANYYLSAKTGLFAEIGYGIGVVTIGFTKKF